MPATRSTTKHRRQTQNSRQDAVQRGQRDLSRCERCGGIFSLYRGSAKRHENVCKRRDEQWRLKEAQIQASRWTPTPQPYTPIASSPEIEFGLEAGVSDIMDLAMDDGACFFFNAVMLFTRFTWFIDDFIAPPAQDVDAEIQLQPRDDPPRTILPPQGNQLITDPSLETTPPPGNPHDEFGVGTVPEHEGLNTLQLGQTLIVYHLFAQHPPEIVDTEKLTLAREPSLPPPSEEPYAPFTTCTDFEQAEIFVHHNCTNTMINDQFRLNQKASQDGKLHTQTMKNAREMHKILGEAGEYHDTSSVCLLHHLQGFHSTHYEAQFESVEISVPYSHGANEEDRTYTVHCRPAMEAILDAIEDPDLRPPFIFYPERHYILNPHTHKTMRVWTDIHTADDWWLLQVHLYTLK